MVYLGINFVAYIRYTNFIRKFVVHIKILKLSGILAQIVVSSFES